MFNEERLFFFFFCPEVSELKPTFQSTVVTIFTTCSDINKFCSPPADTHTHTHRICVSCEPKKCN